MTANSAEAIEALSANGHHFLRSAIDEIEKDSDAGNLNAVIFVAAALEVLLKTRLSVEHWTQLFDDPSKAKISDLKSGEFVSVQASKVIARLNNIASLNIKTDVPDKIFRLRNRVVHYAPPPKLAVRVEVAIGLNFAFELIHDHVLPHLEDNAHSEFTQIQVEISRVFRELDDFRTKRLLVLEGALGAFGVIVECPDCNQTALAIKTSDEKQNCLFCLAEFSPEDLVERYIADVLAWSWHDEADGGESPLHDCPNCEAHSLVSGVKVRNRQNISLVCFSCGEAYKDDDVSKCVRCGRMKVAGDTSVCDDCWSAATS